MKAAVLYQPNTPLVVEDVELLPPRKGEVLVRIASAGICRSDYHIMKGEGRFPLPVVLGHEGAGVVEQVGEEVTIAKRGDPVVLSFVPNCGHCYFCAIGKPHLCDVGLSGRGGMMDGTTRLRKGSTEIYHFGKVACFAEYAVVPETGCVPLPPGFPLDRAALIGCCVPTGVGAAIHAAQVEPGSSVAVIGCGGVGLNILQGARLVNAQMIIGVDLLDSKLELARKLGATHVVNAAREDTVARVKELTGGRGADYTFEAFGSSRTASVAYDAARKGGTVVIVGIAPDGDRVPIDLVSLTRQEKVVKGSYYGSSRPRVDMPRLAQLYLQGRLDLDNLVQRRYRLSEINQAYSDLEEGEPGRGIIVF
ncbi:MAG: Zn-dependent alcohol dehydrogenase [Chloroflexi bacterium]|nr:Zn-dependent alcohol dehydrogenase [Chloroflexota bacterium]